MNPILPAGVFVPDAEARPMPDGRLYIYGSWDVSGNDEYCSRELHCFSTDDLEHWTDHGVIFRNDEQGAGVSWAKGQPLYAPDAIHRDGKYYLYVCGRGNFEGVAVADSPVGSFSPAKRIELADGDGIDPTVLLDDDGQAYLFWGQFCLRGAKLSDDMCSLVPESITKNILTEWEHGFHEGASIRKRDGKYYMLYTDVSRGRATCLSYAMADHPLGPYRKCGVVIDNTGCDPASWNNHGSITEWQGRWYVFYHRSSQGKQTCRRVCIEPIEFDENGYIREVEQTSQGVSAPMDAYHPIEARRACRLKEHSYITFRGDRELLVSPGRHHWGMPDWAEYKHVDFGDGRATHLTVRARGHGALTVRADGGEVIATLALDADEMRSHEAPLCAKVDGVRVVYLFMDGSMEISDFNFK